MVIAIFNWLILPTVDFFLFFLKRKPFLFLKCRLLGIFPGITKFLWQFSRDRENPNTAHFIRFLAGKGVVEKKLHFDIIKGTGK